MVRLVDDVLRSQRFGLRDGLAAPSVTLADPATGTGTFPLGVLHKIAETVEGDVGAGAVPAAVDAAVRRLIAFEMQLGPFAVAQLRILAEIVELTGAPPHEPLRMFVTDTLASPHDDDDWFPGMLAPIATSRREANRIKRDQPVTVVLGNPPYKEKAKGRGGWVEGDDAKKGNRAPLSDWMPPAEWKVGAHSKHLRNLYVYFWRWATWKVFDHGPGDRAGIVCYITVAGFLAGPGFQKMRDYLRRSCDDIWIIDCSPEGHQPEVNTRIFQGVQQPICIVIASRSAANDPGAPARVRFQALPAGHRTTKFEALARIDLHDAAWVECPTEWRAPFLPASTGDWATYPKLEDLFVWNGSGVMPGRTWIIAPDVESLERRWDALVAAPIDQKEQLFHPHLRGGQPGDKHVHKVVPNPLPGFTVRGGSVADDRSRCTKPEPYAYRSFDRQWIIPDARVINQPNPELWRVRSERQVYITALARHAPSSGPALTMCGAIPDHDHYKGSFAGRVFPLFRDAETLTHNFPPHLLPLLGERLQRDVGPEDMFAYIAAVVAHPGYTTRFREDLATPGLRVPLTSDPALFAEATALGRTVIWLHTFGDRFADATAGRPPGPPRLPVERRPTIPKDGAIPSTPEDMPDTIGYDAGRRRLLVGAGFVDNVAPEVWHYEVSGKQVLPQWFSYRRRNRDRPIIGDRRPPSALGRIQPDRWLAEYTAELMNVLNVLGWLVELEPAQNDVMERVCAGQLIAAADLDAAGTRRATRAGAGGGTDPRQTKLL